MPAIAAALEIKLSAAAPRRQVAPDRRELLLDANGMLQVSGAAAERPQRRSNQPSHGLTRDGWTRWCAWRQGPDFSARSANSSRRRDTAHVAKGLAAVGAMLSDEEGRQLATTADA